MRGFGHLVSGDSRYQQKDAKVGTVRQEAWRKTKEQIYECRERGHEDAVERVGWRWLICFGNISWEQLKVVEG